MKKTAYVLLLLIITILLIEVYWITARYSDIIYDNFLENSNWGSASSVLIIIKCLFSIAILVAYIRYYNTIKTIVKLKVTIIIGLFSSCFFIIIATLLWSGIWSNNPNALAEDARTIGDSIWKLGHPLTFLIIDFPIYLRFKFEALQKYWSDYWAYPSVLILFITQILIYIHGIRIIINMKNIRALNKIIMASG